MENRLKLVFPTEEYKKQVMEYLKEHIKNGENILHGAGGLDKADSFEDWIQKINDDLSEEKSRKKGRVVSTQYLAIRKEDNKLVGLIQIRHKLNDYLLKCGGHIGDGVRPSERNKGYSAEMISLALEKCKELKILRVLMTCDKRNVASAKTIIKNGGVLENEIIEEDGNIVQRYWIELKE